MISTTRTGTWWAYVQQHRGRDSNKAIAARLGITPPTVSRWTTAQPTVESVRAFAAAYGRPVLEAFIAANFLSVEEAGAAVVEIKQEMSDRQIADRLLSRLATLHKLEQRNGTDPEGTSPKRGK